MNTQDFDYKELVLEHYGASFTDYDNAECVFDYLSTADGYEVGWAREILIRNIDESDLFYYGDDCAADRVREWIESGYSICISWSELEVEYGIDWEEWAEELELGEYDPEYVESLSEE